MIGQTLSHFQITAKLGEGGMGEVYRAEDTKLGREVAIKVLPEAVASDSERLARFEREAKVLASLNHPNIAAIYSLETVTAPSPPEDRLAPPEEGDAPPGPLHFLVMELAVGEDLKQRLSRGAMPLDEALSAGLQIAKALEAAHERGIIHRDLKPANVMIDPDGRVKVLDFGLAKALDPVAMEAAEASVGEDASPSPALLSLSPTLTAQMTQAGVILGTAAYMAPEQAKGKPVDQRSDIFSFGIVLYEMLTGQQAFPGDDVSEMLASILKTEPDWQALPTDLDPRAREILRRCLRKDPKARRQSIGDVRIEIQEILDGPLEPLAQTEARSAAWGRQITIAVAGLLLGLLIAGGAGWWASDPAPRSPVRFKIMAEGELPRASGTLLSLSTDGKTLVYSASGSGTRQLHLRRMDQLDSSPIAGTEDTFLPFLSPDGKWLGFSREGYLKKVLVTGGAATTICECRTSRSAAWGPDDTIYFTDQSSSVSAVSAAGGTPRPVTSLEGDESLHRGISVLPGGRAILFAALSGGRETARVAVKSLETGERRVLVDGTQPRYVPSGHLLFARSDALWAVPFDTDRLALDGEPIPVLEGIRQEPVGAVQYEVSQEGTLVYVPSLENASLPGSIQWVDRQGIATALTTLPGFYGHLDISPDGREIALEYAGEDGSLNLWILDPERGTLDSLTTGNDLNLVPVWSPDGERIAFRSAAGTSGPNLYSLALIGGEPQLLLQRDTHQAPSSWSPDGTQLVFSSYEPGTGADIWTLSLPDGTPSPFIQTPAAERDAVFSPDGRKIAYISDETGDFEVYITSFPEPGRRTRISRSGGYEPRWSADGTELFYATRNGDLMAVSISTDEASFAAAPLRLFQVPGMKSFDVHPDGQRFAVTRNNPSSESTQIYVVQNWFAELNRLVPID